ncbi:MAG: DUF211 domain-containing protein [Candidatus Nanohaloarchaea archaeon]|nr:DUF211 domain-containing protein [Candidatus Nanohaloarchaea archaeon]
MADTRRLVLDVLKPHNPSILEFSDRIADLDSVESVNSALYEVDEEVENIKMTIVGGRLDFDAIKSEIESMGGSVHSIDQAVCGEVTIDEIRTPQDGSR